jgi:hypothetical protein
VPPLHRAIALEQVHDLAVQVSHDLHLDVTGIAHEFLEVDLVVAECCLGFAARGGNLFNQVRLVSSP